MTIVIVFLMFGVAFSNGRMIHRRSDTGTDDLMQRMISTMGLEHVPSPKQTTVPQVMLRMYHEMTSSRSSCNNRMIKTVSMQEMEGDDVTKIFRFQIPDFPSSAGRLTNAEIRIEFAESQLRSSDSTFALSYEDPSIEWNHAPAEKFVRVPSDPVQADTETEVVWNVSHVIRNRFRPKSVRFMLRNEERMENEMEGFAALPRIKNAYLLFFLQTNVSCASDAMINERPKRQSQDENRRWKRNHLCRRRSLFVDFQEIGWDDWIIAPPSYRAYYCDGKCVFPISDSLNGTNHAVIQTLINTFRPRVPAACCVPSALSPITMLYLDNENSIVLRQYADMVVDSCSCR